MKLTVIGAGVVGLTTAIELLDAGYDVEVISSKVPLETTSVVAAAVWWPFNVAPKERCDTWAEVTRRRLEILAAEVPSSGVRIREGTHRVRDRARRHWWMDLPDAHQVSREATFDLWSLPLPFVDMPIYLPWLEQEVMQRGGRVTINKLSTLDEVVADLVINCTGLGARELVSDSSVYGLRGQVVEVSGVIEKYSLDEDDPEGFTHVYPRTSTTILGGIAEKSEDLEPNQATTDAVLHRAQLLDPQLADANFLAVKVGLRPGRNEVRLEIDLGTKTPVIHNYGHGGCGVTLAWGCAEEVAVLAQSTSL